MPVRAREKLYKTHVYVAREPSATITPDDARAEKPPPYVTGGVHNQK